MNHYAVTVEIEDKTNPFGWNRREKTFVVAFPDEVAADDARFVGAIEKKLDPSIFEIVRFVRSEPVQIIQIEG